MSRIGSVVEYAKGIGTHSHSEIVYDLTDKNVNMFSAFVGIDRAMYNSPASIEFQVYVDGKKEYESGVMRGRDAQQFVEVDYTYNSRLFCFITIFICYTISYSIVSNSLKVNFILSSNYNFFS